MAWTGKTPKRGAALMVNPVVDDEDAVVGQELCLPNPIGSAEMSTGADHPPPGEITA
jgi:hypothetical protein